jgi:hypothetical protein
VHSRSKLANPLPRVVLATLFLVLTVSVGLNAAVAGQASAAPFPTFTCSVSGTLSFGEITGTRDSYTVVPGNGISKEGWTTTSTFVGAAISYGTSGGAGCSGPAQSMAIRQAIKCDRRMPGLPTSNPACEPRKKGYNSWADLLGNIPALPITHSDFGASYAIAIWHSFGGLGRHEWGFKYNGAVVGAKATGAFLIRAGGACGPSEIGFESQAVVRYPHPTGQTLTVTLCLSAITGTGLNPSDNFFDASVDQIGVVNTATIDPATSSVTLG